MTRLVGFQVAAAMAALAQSGVALREDRVADSEPLPERKPLAETERRALPEHRPAPKPLSDHDILRIQQAKNKRSRKAAKLRRDWR